MLVFDKGSLPGRYRSQQSRRSQEKFVVGSGNRRRWRTTANTDGYRYQLTASRLRRSSTRKQENGGPASAANKSTKPPVSESISRVERVHLPPSGEPATPTMDKIVRVCLFSVARRAHLNQFVRMRSFFGSKKQNLAQTRHTAQRRRTLSSMRP